MKDNNSYIAGPMGPSTPVESHHKQPQQSSRLANASDKRAVNKRKQFDAKAVQEATTKKTNLKVKAKVVSKKRLSRNWSWNQELNEFRRRWRKETGILSKVVYLEYELGREPQLDDVLDKLSRAEINAVWDSLIWLYPDLDAGRKGYTIPDAELGTIKVMASI